MAHGYGIASIVLVLATVGCTSTSDGMSTPPEQFVSDDITGAEDFAELHHNDHQMNSTQREIGGDRTPGSASPKGKDYSVGDEKAFSVSEPPPMTEVDATEEWRSSIQPRSRVRLVESTTAPDHPFEGIVQLRWSRNYRDDASYLSGEIREGWHLWFYEYTHSGVHEGWKVGLVPLPDLVIDCVGDVGLVSHGADGVEVGGPLDSVRASFLVPWGGVPLRLEIPSPELLEEIKLRPSSVVVSSVGDMVYAGSGDNQARYVLRTPVRSEGELWKVQARHDGDVFVMTVHPARHECFSGVTWLSDAASGELLACGVDTAATKYIDSKSRPAGPLVLPASHDLPEYLLCAYPLSYHSLR